MFWLELFSYSITRHSFPENKHTLLACLDGDERLRYERFKFDHARWTFATARWLLKNEIAKRLNATAHSVTFQYNRSGKPSLVQGANLFFSLSHTERSIVFALANTEVGVDVEQLERKGEPWLQASAFLNDRLADVIDGCEEVAERKRCFARYWTAMEAQVKMLGTSIFAEKNRFGRNLSPMTKDGHFDGLQHQFYTAALSDEEHLALCVAERLSSVKASEFEGSGFDVCNRLQTNLGVY